MEAAGLAISIASISTVFQSAVDCFGYVQAGKTFSSDYQTNCLKLSNAEVRLIRWGNAIGLGSSTTDAQSLEGLSVRREDVEYAEVLLGHIVHLFTTAQKNGASYNACNNKPGSVAQPSGEVATLQQKMRLRCSNLQRQTTRRQKLQWALFDNKHFARMVDDVQSLVDDLVKLFPPDKSKEQELCEQEANALRDEPALPRLRDVASDCDKPLEEAINRLSAQIVRHLYT